MTVERPAIDELRDRIERETAHHGGTMPERTAIAWSGYLAALVEWQLVGVAEHELLTGLLPVVIDNPAVDILVGRP